MEVIYVLVDIGALIKEERKKQKLSKKILSKRTGFSIRSIDYWEKGERSITLENADKILKALKVGLTIGHIDNK